MDRKGRDGRAPLELSPRVRELLLAHSGGQEPLPTNLAVDVLHGHEEAERPRSVGCRLQELPGRVRGKDSTIYLTDAVLLGCRRGEQRRLVLDLNEALRAEGWVAFARVKGHQEWAEAESRYQPRRSPAGEVSVVAFPTDDRFDVLRLERTGSATYDLSPEDIVDKLQHWERDCSFEVVSAAADQMEIAFRTLPSDLHRFADEVYEFCPDIIGQAYLGPPIDGGGVDDYMDAIGDQTADDIAAAVERDRGLTFWWD